ncbi:hypothetical protein GQ44DRAFT_721351 [Phaeosphaeriaceae sp. PMI808]|nr:hypothetical protein GQ44DRAFT_721351 [Phaeosphaeriaceae sp. PMI808]
MPKKASIHISTIWNTTPSPSPMLHFAIIFGDDLAYKNSITEFGQVVKWSTEISNNFGSDDHEATQVCSVLASNIVVTERQRVIGKVDIKFKGEDGSAPLIKEVRGANEAAANMLLRMGRADLC